MSKTKHTPEPWSNAPLAKPNIIISENDWRRAVLCVNACAGIDNEVLLDDGVRKMREDRDQLLKQHSDAQREYLLVRGLLRESNKQLAETQQALELAQASNKLLQEQHKEMLNALLPSLKLIKSQMLRTGVSVDNADVFNTISNAIKSLQQ